MWFQIFNCQSSCALFSYNKYNDDNNHNITTERLATRVITHKSVGRFNESIYTKSAFSSIFKAPPRLLYSLYFSQLMPSSSFVNPKYLRRRKKISQKFIIINFDCYITSSFLKMSQLRRSVLIWGKQPETNYM